MQVRRDGVIGVAGLLIFLAIAFYYRWNIQLAYFLTGIILYCIAVIILTAIQDYLERQLKYWHAHADKVEEYTRSIVMVRKLLISSHLALGFLTIGLWYNSQDPSVSTGIFLACVSGGLAIPFLLLK
jgi:hypothetical protein